MLKYLMGRRLMGHSKAHRLDENPLFGSRRGKPMYDALTVTRVIYDMDQS